MTTAPSIRRGPARPTPACRLLLVLAALALLPATPLGAQEPESPPPARPTERWGDVVSVFSGNIHIPAEVRQRGSVVCIGGTAVVEGDVTGDVVVVLGGLELSAEVGGVVTGVLSDMELRDAEVNGELVSVLSGLELERSVLRREVVNILGPLNRDDLTELRDQLVNIGFGGDWFPSFTSMLLWLRLFHKFVIFVFLLVLVLLAPERIRLMGEEAPVRYLPAFFTGVLGYLAYLIIWALLTVTFVGIFPAMFAFYVLKWLGIAAIFYAVGRRLGRAAGVSFSVLGAVLLVFAIYAVLMMAPAPLGWTGLLVVATLKLIFFLAIELPAVGLVILTRFGTRRSPVAGPVTPPSPPAPPAVPEPPPESPPPPPPSS